MKIRLLSVLMIFVAVTGCKKDDDDATPSNNPPAVVAAKSFNNVAFTKQLGFFSTEGTSVATMDSNSAKLNPGSIDLTYTYDFDYDAPGMLDPIVRSSSTYYWSSNFCTPWSSGSEEVTWYKTTLTGQDFTDAKSDQSKINTFFSDTVKVKITTHTIWPYGACVGGRQSTTGFHAGQVFGFERTSDARRGLIQIVSLPNLGLDSETTMNIIIQH